jgi:hypothetical protein
LGQLGELGKGGGEGVWLLYTRNYISKGQFRPSSLPSLLPDGPLWILFCRHFLFFFNLFLGQLFLKFSNSLILPSFPQLFHLRISIL